MKTILEIRQLTKKFGSFVAVDNVSFQIEKGSIYGLLGPNGSGKSTTLGMILNVVNKTSGEYQWFNGNISNQQALKRIGAIIERPNFYPYMSAYENLRLVCKIKGATTDKIQEKLQLVGLWEVKDRKFSAFSLGMKQRLAIASALLNDPEILILDEPTNGLDPQGIHQIRELIRYIASQGVTVLLASHLLDEVEKVCTHVVVLQQGKMRYNGRVDAMFNDYGFFELATQHNEKLQEALRDFTQFDKITIEGNLIRAYLKTDIPSEELNKRLFEKGYVLSHLVKRKESLENQFLKLTNHTN
ncbi:MULTISPECIES: ABC transporter ATP-binding protein [Capnocytophaga]|uniref:ABC transporter ATP-binding protein n=1 Tax=Capnocytophaga canis TaxID=1848903 RepID=A0A3A1YI91_9FLAO|nr:MULTISPECIES: ATP-binding cassette domain-containing protein [Capnocytophaga]ATA72470.1 ABC transporter ATP-binding protein [Capnocytophaga sp. H4358]ATA74580.1 ABC transporter ATP-binding protein [Capnocytophaga sp. H2931]RIY35737.1 ABC transporter ATP-binding protein [Capnocytophaga canis]GIM59952.1 ABC transporter ATP-binding protein [Capnocytophaga canis]